MSRFTFAQITDLHLRAEPGPRVHGMDPRERLERIVERIRSHPDAELVVVTGDLSGDDRPEAYGVFLETVRPLEVPVHVLPGNHDVRVPFGEVFLGRQDGRLYRSVRHRHARLLLLDSLWDGQVQGRIGPGQLDWVRRVLAGKERGDGADAVGMDPPEVTLAFVHHPPAVGGVEWLDPHRIEDGADLVRALVSGGVSRLFFGHVHMPMTLVANGLVCQGAPATSLAFSDARGGERVLPGSAAITWIQVEGAEVRSWIELLPA